MSLYPPIQPFAVGTLRVDEVHSVYWERCGNPLGRPILFLHGGPGAGAAATHRRFFDPAHYHIIILDQRGAGRSTPLGETRNNGTRDLIDDLERLRSHLGVERWIVFGGSWGSTLALAYAEAHPRRCRGLILRGIFLMRRKEIDWFLHSMGLFYPEAARRFLEFLPANERGDPLNAYARRLNSSDHDVRRAAGLAWAGYEASCSTLVPRPDQGPGPTDAEAAVALARIEAHYFMNEMFDPEDELLRNIDRVREIPGVIVQGRHDVVCPPVSAFELADAWPEAEMVVVNDAGHSAMETGIREALVRAADRFRDLAP